MEDGAAGQSLGQAVADDGAGVAGEGGGESHVPLPGEASVSAGAPEASASGAAGGAPDAGDAGGPASPLGMAGAANIVNRMQRLRRRATYKYVDPNTGKLPLSTKVIYGLPQFSITSLTMLITIYGTQLYEEFGAGLSFIAFFTALARSFDVMTDPAMGWFSDQTRTRWGRRRPFMATGCWGYAIAFVLLMSPPASLSEEDENGEVGQSISLYFGFFYVLFYLFDTVSNVPYAALGPELSDDYDERSSLFFYNKLFGAIGTLIGAAGPALLGQFIDSKRDVFTYTALFFGILYVFFMEMLVFKIREREASFESENPPLVPAVLRSLKNVAFRPLLVGWVLDFIALASLAAMFPFFIQYVVQPDDADLLLGTCMAALFMAGISSMPIWLFLTKKFGKRNTWLAYNLFNSCSNFLFIFVGKGDTGLLVGITVLNGIPTGGQFLIDSILADTIDYDEFLNGTRSEGSFSVWATFAPKLVSIPAQALPLAVISAAGFVPSDEGEPQPQTELVRFWIRAIFVILPSVATFVAFVVKLRFPIKTRATVNKISEGIDLHSQGKGAQDPVTGLWVELPKMTAEETKRVWLLDNFSQNQLRAFRAGDGAGLVRHALQWIAIGVLLLVIFGAGVVVTFPFLDRPDIAWIPSLCVIMAGMSFASICVNYLRLRAARDLRSDKPPVDLIDRIIAPKRKGQRGGNLEIHESDAELVQSIQEASAAPAAIPPLPSLSGEHSIEDVPLNNELHQRNPSAPEES